MSIMTTNAICYEIRNQHDITRIWTDKSYFPTRPETQNQLHFDNLRES